MLENILLQQGEKIVPIRGYEGLYSITSHGRVWSHLRFVGNKWYGNYFLKFRINRDGYPILNLSKKSKSKTVTIHRLVAEAFIPNPYNLPEVNHKDTNKSNNNKNNLEWCTHIENSKHASVNSLFKYKKISKYYGVTISHGTKNKWRAQITINGKSKYLGAYFTEIDAARTYNKFIINNNLEQPLNKLK